MRELEGVNDLFRSKFEANPRVRDIIDKAKRLDTRALIDVLGQRKNIRRSRRSSRVDRCRRKYNYSSKSSSTKFRYRSS